MGLRDIWIEAIYRSATASRRVRLLLTPVGPLLFFGLIVLLLWLGYCLDGWLAWPAFPPPPYNMAAGLLLGVPGVGMVLWCTGRFLKARGTPVPLNPPRELVATGPYGVTRNPMLTGLFATLFGIGLGMSSLGMTFVATPLFIIINVVELKLIEEPELEKRLGPDYVAYKRRVPMFVPRLFRKP